MGNGNKNNPPELDGSVKPDGATTNDGNPRPETSAKRGRGRPRKTESNNNGTKEKVVPRVVALNLEEEGEQPPEPKKPNRKPSKKSNAAKTKKVGLSKENVSQLLFTSFEIIGSREGFEIWKLDKKECDQLADPIAKIISRSKTMEKITDEYTEYIALTIAVGTIMIPRLMIHLSESKKKKKKKEPIPFTKKEREHDQRTERTGDKRNENRETPPSDRRHHESTTESSQTIGSELHRLIPVISP